MWLGEVSSLDSVLMAQVTECLSDNILKWISPTKSGIMESLTKTVSLTVTPTTTDGSGRTAESYESDPAYSGVSKSRLQTDTGVTEHNGYR